MTNEEKTELLGLLGACQSAYHIDSTPGHRFGGLPSVLKENRDALVEYVQELLDAEDNEPLTCDFCAAETSDPWHGSTLENKHIHACEKCLHLLPGHSPKPPAVGEAVPALAELPGV